MKKIIICLICCVFIVCGCSNNNDAIKFKKEYEEINGTVNNSDLKHRDVSISKDNPFVYVSASDIVDMIDNGDTFYVYFGSRYCPWCRSVVEKAILVAKRFNVKKIYYVDIWGGDHEEILRDKYYLDDDNNLVKSIEAGESYYDLLNRLDNVLDDYILSDSDGNSISVNEKRIFAPNYIYIENGKAVSIVDGISSLQKNSRDSFTDDILNDEEKIFTEFFDRNEKK